VALNEPLELALGLATNWLLKVMLTLWEGPKLSPLTRTLVPTEPLTGNMDTEGGGFGVGVGGGVGVGVAVGVGMGVLVGAGVAVLVGWAVGVWEGFWAATRLKCTRASPNANPASPANVNVRVKNRVKYCLSTLGIFRY